MRRYHCDIREWVLLWHSHTHTLTCTHYTAVYCTVLYCTTHMHCRFRLQVMYLCDETIVYVILHVALTTRIRLHTLELASHFNYIHSYSLTHSLTHSITHSLTVFRASGDYTELSMERRHTLEHTRELLLCYCLTTPVACVVGEGDMNEWVKEWESGGKVVLVHAGVVVSEDWQACAGCHGEWVSEWVSVSEQIVSEWVSESERASRESDGCKFIILNRIWRLKTPPIIV
jgi:hypothetical protein